MQFQKSHVRWYAVVFWVVVAAIAGTSCMVLPPYLVRGGIKQTAYGWPVIPWFAIAYANLRPVVTMSSFFLIGLAFGIAKPRLWLVMGLSALGSPIILNGINILYDWTHDPTSHNLWPFEVVILMGLSLPVLVGGLLGFLFRRFIDKRQSSVI